MERKDTGSLIYIFLKALACFFFFLRFMYVRGREAFCRLPPKMLSASGAASSLEPGARSTTQIFHTEARCAAVTAASWSLR